MPSPPCEKASAGVGGGPAPGELNLEVCRLDRRTEEFEAAGGCGGTEVGGGNSKEESAKVWLVLSGGCGGDGGTGL